MKSALRDLTGLKRKIFGITKFISMHCYYRYMLDPIMIAEYVIYLEQNFCLDEWEYCKEGVKEYFPSMHLMAMEK